MATLILEDGGNTRRFRLNEGKLSIGSGEQCTLRIEQGEVAEVHAQLEYSKGTAMLRLAKGVAPASVKGRKIAGEHAMSHGVPVHIGGATITVEFEGAEKETLVSRRNVRSRAEIEGRRTPARSGTPARSAAPARPRRRGIPTWAIVIVGLAVAGVAWRYSVSKVGGAGARDFDANSSYARVLRKQKDGDLNGVLAELERIKDEEMTPEWRAKFRAVNEDIEARKAEAKLSIYNQAGTEYLETQLRKFEKSYLKGKPQPPKVRVFLLRLAHFTATWPQHPEIDWANRLVARYSKIVDITQPPTFEDIAFEVKTLTWAKPRDYGKAFALLDAFIEDSTGADFDQASTLYDEKLDERLEYFKDRILQAKHDWKQGEKGSAVEWLATLVTMIGDEAMAKDAAELLLSLPGVDGPLRGYHEGRRDMFDALVKNELIAKRAKKLGLL